MFRRGWIKLFLDRKIFFYHYKYIQIHACENDICEYRNVDQIKFFKKTRSPSFNLIFFILRSIKYTVLYYYKFCTRSIDHFVHVPSSFFLCWNIKNNAIFKLSIIFVIKWHNRFFKFFFLSHCKLCLTCCGPCTKNKVLLYFIHKVKFYKDKVI